MKKLLLVLLLLGGLLAGLAYWINTPRLVPVREDLFTFSTVTRGDIRETVSATGSIKPRNLVFINSKASGTVVEVLGEVNDVVEEGKVLVRLDDQLVALKVQQAEIGVTTAEAAVTQARALRTAAEKGLKFQQDMAKTGFRKDLEKAEQELAAAAAGVQLAQARVKDAENQLEQARAALEMTHLRVPVLATPFSGSTGGGKRDFLILDRSVEVGQMVGPMPAAPLFTLAANLSQMEVHTEVVEGDVGRVRPGQTAYFTINSYDDPDLVFQGTVRTILPKPTNVKGAIYYNAVIEVDNQKHPGTGEWRLLPGMTTSVDFVVQQKTNTWKIPLAATNFELEPAYQSPEAQQRLDEWARRPDARDWRPLWIWQAEPGRAWPVFVRLNDSANGLKGLQDGDYIEVLQWEPDAEPRDNSPSRVITNAPPARKPGLLDRPANFKVS